MKQSNHIDIMLIIISKFVLVYDEKKQKPNPNTPALTPNCRTKCLSLFWLIYHYLRTGMTIRPQTA